MYTTGAVELLFFARNYNVLYVEGEGNLYYAMDDNTRKVSFEAGEYKKVAIEMDLTNDSLAKDWSVVAQAEGEVYVYPVDETEVSDSFQVIGGDGREGFTRPELPLPTHDASAFTAWVNDGANLINK